MEVASTSVALTTKYRFIGFSALLVSLCRSISKAMCRACRRSPPRWQPNMTLAELPYLCVDLPSFRTKLLLPRAVLVLSNSLKMANNFPLHFRDLLLRHSLTAICQSSRDLFLRKTLLRQSPYFLLQCGQHSQPIVGIAVYSRCLEAISATGGPAQRSVIF